jgi:hypothetical protein
MPILNMLTTSYLNINPNIPIYLRKLISLKISKTLKGFKHTTQTRQKMKESKLADINI